MTPEELRRAIAKGRTAPVYFFSGPETLLKLAAIDALAGLVPEATRAFNVQSFHAFEADLADVLTAARTLPFMGDRRLVVLREIEKMRATESRADLLAEYLAAPETQTLLVVTCEDDDKAKGLVKRHGAGWTVVEFRPPKGRALLDAVAAEAARLGCTIDQPAVAALVETVGEDRGRVFNELAKLRLAVGAGGAIDAAAVAKFAAGYAHQGMFAVVDAVSGRDLAASLRLLASMTLKDEEYLPLLGALGKRLRVLWFLAAPPREVPKAYNVMDWQAQRLRADARRFTRAELERGLEGMRELDDRVKSTAVGPRLLLEHFLLGFLPK
jgi:DNA polymerase-3 subunit delta